MVEVDTIAAISTSPGPAAIAVVRLSGPRAAEVLERIAPELSLPEPRRAQLAGIRDPRTHELLDRAVVTLMRAPASYTGEDTVEISTHGGWLGPALVLEACVAAGARRADAGEFTRRAYLNGKLDLVQAEAVGDLIEGRSPMARRAALLQLDRGLSARIAEVRQALIGLEAMLVHHLDFPEEDEAPVPVARIVADADIVAERLRSLVRTAAEGELLREGALAVIAGRPNAGKSSLFNALLGCERAIVTALPGTTRDAIEAPVALGGFPFRLVDTAGLRESDEPVERIGIEVARRYLAAADVVIFCAEARRPLDADERAFIETRAGRPLVLVRTKADLHDALAGGTSEAHEVCVSTRSGEGLDELRRRLAALVYAGLVEAGGEAPVLTRARQTEAARLALDELEAFSRALREGVGPEVASAHLRPAETALEELLGVITPDDVLDRLFADFCIGK